MSFIEHIYHEMKAIDPGITSDQFSTKWLNKCKSYYRSYKASQRDITFHALMCLIQNLEEKSSSLRMKNNCNLLHRQAQKYEDLKAIAHKQSISFIGPK